MFVNFNILNQLGSPAINSNTFANRPAAGQTGRLFVSTDTFEIYRDNGTTWDLIGGPGSSTITGTGTATQVAYFTSSQAIGSSANLYWDDANIRLGIGTATPGARLDIHGSNVMAQFNGTTSASNSYIAFQRTGSNVWRVGDNYNSGDNFFELRNSVLSNDALTIQATTNKAAFLAQQTYLGGQAQGALFTYNLTAAAGTTFATPNALSAVNAFLNLSLGGNATLPAGTRQGIEGNSRVSFTGAGTLTMSQGSTLRAYAAITGVHSFAGSAVGTITHLAGIRLCFPDNIGSAINITNNYGLLINDQSAGTGTITYTNRWGIYQEGASDLNYFAANLLIGSTVNNGAALQVTGNGYFSGNVGIGTTSPAVKLDVNGDVNLASGYTLSWGGAYGANIPSIAGVSGVGSNIRFYPSGSTTGETMRITSTGNVGIGTTSPAVPLDVVAGSGGGAISMRGNANDIADLYYFSNNGATLFSYIRGTSTDLEFRAEGSRNLLYYTNGSERMRITNAGYLLLGTTVANYGQAGRGTFEMNGSTDNIFVQKVGGSLANYIYSTASSSEIYSTNVLQVAVNSLERMRVTTGGNVLIGTTTDAGQKLQVSGTARASQFNSTSGTISVAPATPTTFFTPGSVGLYIAHIYLNGNATQTWDAVIIFSYNVTDIQVVNQTNGVNVSTIVSGTNIQVRQIGGATYDFDYQIIKIA